MSNNDRELSVEELVEVSGGAIKGALEGVCTNDNKRAPDGGGKNDPAQMFQQILQQLSQR